MTTISVLPFSLEWAVEPTSWEATDDTLTITAGPETDVFVAPDGSSETHNAPCLLGMVGGDFQFSARISVDHLATYDAGTLLLLADDRHWIKLAFERGVDGLARVVSVVTRVLSDDCDSFVVSGDHVWLRISRIGESYALHASLDGVWWAFVRNFSLDVPAGDVAIGFSAQAPMGEECTAVFGDIRFAVTTLAELRDGS